MNICNKVTSVIFCAVIAGLTAASMLNPVRERSETENRDLAQMPTFSLESLLKGEFTSDYETFITDQFVARDAWIAVKTYAELALGKRDSNMCISRTTAIISRNSHLMKHKSTQTSRISPNFSHTSRINIIRA